MRSMLCIGPHRRMDATIDGRVLGRQAERVEAHREHDVQPLHAAHASHDVRTGGRVPVPDVQVARRVGIHGQQVVLLPRDRRSSARYRPSASQRSRQRCSYAAGSKRGPRAERASVSVRDIIGPSFVRSTGQGGRGRRTGGHRSGHGGRAAQPGRGGSGPARRADMPTRTYEAVKAMPMNSSPVMTSSCAQLGQLRRVERGGVRLDRSSGLVRQPGRLGQSCLVASGLVVGDVAQQLRRSRPGTATAPHRGRSRTAPGRRSASGCAPPPRRARSLSNQWNAWAAVTRSADAGSRPVSSAVACTGRDEQALRWRRGRAARPASACPAPPR